MRSRGCGEADIFALDVLVYNEFNIHLYPLGQGVVLSEDAMYHKVILIGNLGRDPELRYTPQGTPVTTFTVATNRIYTNAAGEQTQETVWFRVSAWGRLAETCNQYLRRGMRVYIEGRLVPDPNTGSPRMFTRQDGTVGTSFELRAQVVKFLTSRQDMDAAAPASSTPAAASSSVDDLPADEDEIPF